MTEENPISVPESDGAVSAPPAKKAATRRTTGTRVTKAGAAKAAKAAAAAQARLLEAGADGDAPPVAADEATAETPPPASTRSARQAAPAQPGEPESVAPRAEEPAEPRAEEPRTIELPPALVAPPAPHGAPERRDYPGAPPAGYTPVPPSYAGSAPRSFVEPPPSRGGPAPYPERTGYQGQPPVAARAEQPAAPFEAGFVGPNHEQPAAPGDIVAPAAGATPPVSVRNYPVPASVQMQEMRDGRDERPVEPRGLRFRGRDGRAELRGRVEPQRNFRGRPDNRGAESRGPEPRRFEGEPGGRPMPAPRPEPYRGEVRNDVRDAPPRDVPPRDTPPRDVPPRDVPQRNLPRDGAVNDAPRSDARVTERDAARGRNDLDLTTLEEMNLPELRELAKDLNLPAMAKKTDIVFRILESQAETSGNLFKKGFLEILPDGKGFLRTEGYLPSNEDVYVSQSQIKRFNLKTGDNVSGQVRAPKEMERYYGLLRVEAINGESPEAMRTRKEFEKLTPIFPDEKFRLETTQENITARIIDLVTPLGKGQRGLIVAPPKAGKTSLIKNIANSIAANHPEVYLIVLLIDERPEEVTDISRSVKGEVVASTFDEMPENHMRVADMVMEKAKRMVEQKHDVVILLDSITRLSRASNLVVTPSGRTLTGGLDPAAMYRPKRMFGAARNIEEGGSLTILATTLVDTGSRMDDMIFEEFKGTGNLDLVLDRGLFDQRIFPSIDINKSGTRRDDLLLSKEDLAATFHLRRTLAALDNDKAILLLIDRLKNTKTNADFMQIVQKSSRQAAQS